MKSKISELPLSEAENKNLKEVFGIDYDFVLDLPLGKYLMNISWLKSYTDSDKTKEEFYNFVFRKLY